MSACQSAVAVHMTPVSVWCSAVAVSVSSVSACQSAVAVHVTSVSVWCSADVQFAHL